MKRGKSTDEIGVVSAHTKADAIRQAIKIFDIPAVLENLLVVSELTKREWAGVYRPFKYQTSTLVRDDFTIGYRCTGFRFDLAGPLIKAGTNIETRAVSGDNDPLPLTVCRAGAIDMPFMRRLKSLGQATVILLALGPFLPLSFFSEICEAAIERLSKTRFGKACINTSERLALYYGRQELL
jgi:hypothetical protein